MKRSDCKDGPRPCTQVSCKHHTLVEIGSQRSLKAVGLNRLRRGASAAEVEEWTEQAAEILVNMTETCTLDVADKGGVSGEYIGDVFQISREAVRLCTNNALTKLRNK